MDQNPLVSIGIPTYNRAESLKKALDSAINQTYQNLEIIISDNASTDETKEICEDYQKKDHRIKYLRQVENVGAIANFNIVLKEATGKYFMWLADDDWIDLNFIEECLNLFRKNEELVLVGGLAKYYSNRQFSFLGEKLDIVEKDPKKRIQNYYKNVSYNGIFYGLMKRNLIKNLWLEEQFGADAIFLARLAYLGKVKTISNVFLHRNLGGVSKSVESMADSLNISKMAKKFPWMSLSINQFRDIMKKEVFKNKSFFYRISIASSAFLSVCKKYVIKEISISIALSVFLSFFKKHVIFILKKLKGKN